LLFRWLKKGTIVEIIAALLILLFLYTAISKSFQINNTVYVLEKTPVLSGSPETIAWTVVVVEYILTALLFIPGLRKLGLYGSLFLLVSFTIYIGYMMTFVPKLPCSCGGVISQMTWKQHLIFNICFILLALAGILLSRRQTE